MHVFLPMSRQHVTQWCKRPDGLHHLPIERALNSGVEYCPFVPFLRCSKCYQLGLMPVLQISRHHFFFFNVTNVYDNDIFLTPYFHFIHLYACMIASCNLWVNTTRCENHENRWRVVSTEMKLFWMKSEMIVQCLCLCCVGRNWGWKFWETDLITLFLSGVKILVKLESPTTWLYSTECPPTLLRRLADSDPSSCWLAPLWHLHALPPGVDVGAPSP